MAKTLSIVRTLVIFTVIVSIIIIVGGFKTWPHPFWKPKFFANLVLSGLAWNLNENSSFTISKGYLTKISNSAEHSYLTAKAFRLENTDIPELQDQISSTHDICIYPKRGSNFLLEILDKNGTRKKAQVTLSLNKGIDRSEPNTAGFLPLGFKLKPLKRKGEIALRISRVGSIRRIETETLDKIKLTLSNVMISYGGQLAPVRNVNQDIYGFSNLHRYVFSIGSIDEPDRGKCEKAEKIVRAFKKSRSEEDEDIRLDFEKVKEDDYPIVEFKDPGKEEHIVQDINMLSLRKGHIKISDQEPLIDVQQIAKLPTDGTISGYVTEIRRFKLMSDGLRIYVAGKTDSIRILGEEKLQTWLDYVLSHKAVSIMIGLVIIMFDKILTYMASRTRNQI